jgi:hypothetical protein
MTANKKHKNPHHGCNIIAKRLKREHELLKRLKAISHNLEVGYGSSEVSEEWYAIQNEVNSLLGNNEPGSDTFEGVMLTARRRALDDIN